MLDPEASGHLQREEGPHPGLDLKEAEINHSMPEAGLTLNPDMAQLPHLLCTHLYQAWQVPTTWPF